MKKFSNCLRARYGDALVNAMTTSARTAVEALVDAAKAAGVDTVTLVTADKPFTGELGLFATGLTEAVIDDVRVGTDGLPVVVCTTVVAGDVMPRVDLVDVCVDVDGQLVQHALVATVPLGAVAWAERVLRYIIREAVEKKPTVS